MSTIDRQAIEEKIKEIMAKQFGREPEKISSDQRLIEDLGMDSFAAVELIFELEDRLAIKIPDSDVINLKTIGDVVDYVCTRLAQRENL